MAAVREGDWHKVRRITLADVAERAQVSPALVSIVMRNARGASAATRERVQAAARELGYRPDARARSLASQRSGIIGVMFGVDVGAFHFDLLEVMYEAARQRGQNLLLSSVSRGRDELEAASYLQDFRFDALIMLGPATARPVLAGQVPLVVVGWHVDHPGVDVVRTSDEHGMAEAVSHLIDLGHRSIAHLDGGDGLVAQTRRDNYRRAMAAHGLADQIRVVPGGQTQLDGQRAARAILASGDLPTALISYNDDTAVAAMGLLAQQGVLVPRDLSVVGWDDSAASALSPVALTSVGQRAAEMARLAVGRAVDRVEQRPVTEREIVLEPILRIRASTGPA